MPATPATTVATALPENQSVTGPSLPAITQTGSEWKEGVQLYEKGEYAAAAERLDVAARQRSDAYTHYLLGLAQWKSGQNAQAEASLERAMQLSPRSARTCVNLARVRMSLEDPTGALDAAVSALECEPGSSEALHQQGRALAALGRTGEGIEILRKAHEAAPENGYIANTLGYVLLQAGQVEEAVPILEGARGVLPGVTYVRNNLGVAYERTGKLQDAFDEFQAAVHAGDSGGKAAASVARLQPILKRDLMPEPSVAQVLDGSGANEPTENTEVVANRSGTDFD